MPQTTITSKPLAVQEDVLVILFDIDGTLIDSAGAGGAALLLALETEFGVTGALGVPLQGRTDLGILPELLLLNGIESSTENFDRLCQRYFSLLPELLSQGRGRILPGVVAVLDCLRKISGCHVGLLTGNLPLSARMKLEYFGLWDSFEFGIFGDVAAHRPDLSTPAIAAIKNRSGQEVLSQRIILVGDTPLDVELAQAMQARCLAVCTGGFPAEQLMLAGACRAVEDLSHTADIMDWFFQQTEVCG